MAYSDWNDDQRQQMDRDLADASYQRENDDMWNELIGFVITIFLVIGLILAGLSWLDAKYGWNLAPTVSAWIKRTLHNILTS